MKNILIVGANGFIGRNIYEYLSNKKGKYNLYTPSSKELNAINEVEVEKYLRNKYFDVVIHSAVHNPGTNKLKKFDDLLEYSLRMFYTFEKHQDLYGKMLYFGSGAEYGKQNDIMMVQENQMGNIIPDSDYGLAKYIINKSISNSMNIFNLRLFGIYGKYEDWHTKFISNICCKAIKGLPLTIRQNVYFDYLFIKDFCKIVEWFIENNPRFKDCNVVTGKRVDLLSIAKKVVKICGRDIPIYIGKDGLANEYTASNNRLISEIGNFEFTNMDEAVSSLYNWYENNESMIDIYPLLYQ